MKFFRINISGTKFFLSQKNIDSDAPNIFTEKFSREKNSTRMALDRNPHQFEQIHRYLQGYRIMHENMSELELDNILLDAKYYKLNRLQDIVLNLQRRNMVSTICNMGEDNPYTGYAPLINYPDTESECSECESEISSSFSTGSESDNLAKWLVLRKNYVKNVQNLCTKSSF